ncbi:hypothetical protein F5884DRAFT_898947 [Xylogone sp. PMI_703]|nr:hypothetical protein F5884DRAFT_898947 [Xylogone sp. PMI_703]
MFSLKTITAGVLASVACLQGVSGYITDVEAPASAAAGSTISVQLHTGIYIQNEIDFGIAWGLYGYTAPCDDCIGTTIDYTNVYGDSTFENRTVSTYVTVPADTPSGDYQFVAAIPTLMGASGEMSTRYFRSNITITSA